MKEVKACMIGLVEFTTIYEDPLLMIPTISQIIQVLKDLDWNQKASQEFRSTIISCLDIMQNPIFIFWDTL